MYNAHQITREFEAALCEYTGAPYAVAVSNCTMALTLAVAWHLQHRTSGDGYVGADHRPMRPAIEIPKRTYVSVPMAIIHAGGRPTFRDEDWLGAYRLKPLPVWDCARWFTAGMWNRTVEPQHIRWYGPGQMACVSFHHAKILGDTQGGAILHDNPGADAWLREARFDGRTEGIDPKDDVFTQIGWHCYLSPDVAGRLLLKLSTLPQHNDQLPNDEYPDLSSMEIFK